MIYLLINWYYTTNVSLVYSILRWDTWYNGLRDFFMYSALAAILQVVTWLLTWLKLSLVYGEQRHDPEDPHTLND